MQTPNFVNALYELKTVLEARGLHLEAVVLQAGEVRELGYYLASDLGVYGDPWGPGGDKFELMGVEVR